MKWLERRVAFKWVVLAFIAFGVGVNFLIDIIPVRRMEALRRVMEPVVAVVSILVEVGAAAFVVYLAILFFRDRSRRARFIRFVSSWPLILSGILFITAWMGWYLTNGRAYSCGWYDQELVAATAPFAGIPERVIEKWMLVEDGEIWLKYSTETKSQDPPPAGPFVDGHQYYSPWICWFAGGPLNQVGAEKYEGAWASAHFAGLAFRSERWNGGRRGSLDSRGWQCFLSIPFWIFAVPFVAALPLRLRNWRRHEVGRCSLCSYDLRAHAVGGKCPECGTVIPPRHAVTISGEPRSSP